MKVTLKWQENDVTLTAFEMDLPLTQDALDALAATVKYLRSRLDPSYFHKQLMGMANPRKLSPALENYVHKVQDALDRRDG